jgi:hypothetical protein
MQNREQSQMHEKYIAQQLLQALSSPHWAIIVPQVNAMGADQADLFS